MLAGIGQPKGAIAWIRLKEGGSHMNNEENMDVFERAFLYLYRTRLESLGVEADLRVIRVDEPNSDE